MRRFLQWAKEQLANDGRLDASGERRSKDGTGELVKAHPPSNTQPGVRGNAQNSEGPDESDGADLPWAATWGEEGAAGAGKVFPSLILFGRSISVGQERMRKAVAVGRAVTA